MLGVVEIPGEPEGEFGTDDGNALEVEDGRSFDGSSGEGDGLRVD